MGVATGCGSKEVYRFPHTTYPYSSCICSFAAAALLFVHFLMFFVLVYIKLYRKQGFFQGGAGGAFAPPRLTLAPPWNWQICILREPCPPTKLHIAVLPPLGPNPERNTGKGSEAIRNHVLILRYF